MVIKLIVQLIWEAAILPTIRFIIWYLPMLYNDVWSGRRKWNYLDLVLQSMFD